MKHLETPADCWGHGRQTGNTFVLLVRPVGDCVMACNLFILEKGKPIRKVGTQSQGPRDFDFAEAWLPKG